MLRAAERPLLSSIATICALYFPGASALRPARPLNAFRFDPAALRREKVNTVLSRVQRRRLALLRVCFLQLWPTRRPGKFGKFRGRKVPFGAA